jgi:hypothetical protein
MVQAIKRMISLMFLKLRKPDHRITKLITHYKKIGTNDTWVNLFDKELGWYYLNNGNRFRCVELCTRLNNNRITETLVTNFFSLKDITEVYAVWNLMSTADKYCFYQELLRKR